MPEGPVCMTKVQASKEGSFRSSGRVLHPQSPRRVETATGRKGTTTRARARQRRTYLRGECGVKRRSSTCMADTGGCGWLGEREPMSGDRVDLQETGEGRRNNYWARTAAGIRTDAQTRPRPRFLAPSVPAQWQPTHQNTSHPRKALDHWSIPGLSISAPPLPLLLSSPAAVSPAATARRDP